MVRAEQALFGGRLPSSTLQAALSTPGRPGALDYLATAVHASYFFGFVLVGLAIWLFARERFAFRPLCDQTERPKPAGGPGDRHWGGIEPVNQVFGSSGLATD